MPAESRQHPRAQLAGIDVRYPDVNGNEVVARARDIGRGGLFVETPHLVPIGETRALVLSIAGEEAPITATARVAWARTKQDDPQRPIGMAFAFLEVDAAAVDRIGALVAGRERTISGLGHGVAAAPGAGPVATAPAVVLARDTSIGIPREATIGGVGGRTSHPLREQTLIGVGDDTAPPLEPEKSIPIGLVAKKATPSTADGERAVASPRTRAASRVEDDVPRRSGSGMLVSLALLGILGGAGYVFRDRIAAFVAPPLAPASPAEPTAPASASATPPGSGSASVPAFGSAEADAASPADAGAQDAAIRDASIADASAHDAGARGGAHHPPASGGAKKATPAPAHAPKPKPAPSAPEPENPY